MKMKVVLQFSAFVSVAGDAIFFSFKLLLTHISSVFVRREKSLDNVNKTFSLSANEITNVLSCRRMKQENCVEVHSRFLQLYIFLHLTIDIGNSRFHVGARESVNGRACSVRLVSVTSQQSSELGHISHISACRMRFIIG